MNTFVFQSSDLPVAQANDVWESLQQGIREIQNGNASNLRFEELYRNAYTLTLHKHGDLLYNGVRDTICGNLELIFSQIAKTSEEAFLEVFVTEWSRHKLIMTMIRDVLMYLDKTYCIRAKKTLIYDLGVELFKQNVLDRDEVPARLRTKLLSNVMMERGNQTIDRLVMRNCLSMLVDVSSASKEVYQELFEQQFLLDTRHFYEKEAKHTIANNTIPVFLENAEKRVLEEEDRANAYLDESTKSKLLEIVETTLIRQYRNDIVNNELTGVASMFMQDKIEDLLRMYRLFSRVPEASETLRIKLNVFVKQAGEKIVSDKENKKNPQKFVQDVLSLRRKYFRIVKDSFLGDRSFSRALKDSFEYFINLDARAAQYLSLYIDDMFKSGIRDVSEDLVDQKLDEVIVIFRYLSDKDVFEDFYKQHLASRLLTGKGTSDDIEKLMISKLKAECGHQFTSKLEGMFKNIEHSKEINRDFSQHLTALNSSNDNLPDVSINVLTSGFWPFPNVDVCRLPDPVHRRALQFQDFYSERHSGHRLTWQTSLGNAEVRCDFEEGRKELHVHTYQMCILMLFNEGKKFSFKEIQERTQIPEKELERHLLSLAHPKLRILKKKPNVKFCAPDHLFAYNNGFTHRQFRIKVKLLSVQQNEKEESQLVPSSVLEARKNRVEAAIVRIMKARQHLEHNNLVGEVCKQLSKGFQADPAFIKKRIESLIERDYLQRNNEDRRVYEYLA